MTSESPESNPEDNRRTPEDPADSMVEESPKRSESVDSSSPTVISKSAEEGSDPSAMDSPTQDSPPQTHASSREPQESDPKKMIDDSQDSQSSSSSLDTSTIGATRASGEGLLKPKKELLSHSDDEEEFEDSASTSSIAEHSYKPPLLPGVDSPVIERSAGGGGSTTITTGTHAEEHHDRSVGLQAHGSLRSYDEQPIRHGRATSSAPGSALIPERAFIPSSELAHPAIELYYNYSPNRSDLHGSTGGPLPPELPPGVPHPGMHQAMVPGSGLHSLADEYYGPFPRAVAERWGYPGGRSYPGDDESVTSRLSHSRSGDLARPRRSKVEKRSSRRSRRDHTVPAVQRFELRPSSSGGDSQSGGHYMEERNPQPGPSLPYYIGGPELAYRSQTWGPENIDQFNALVGSTYSEAAAASLTSGSVIGRQGHANPEQQYQQLMRADRRASEIHSERRAHEEEDSDQPYVPRGGRSSHSLVPHQAWRVPYDPYTSRRHQPIYGSPIPPLTHPSTPPAKLRGNPMLGSSIRSLLPQRDQYPQSGNPDEHRKAKLEVEGDLWEMTRGWSIRESKIGRRLVKFERRQHGATISLRFETVEPEDYDSDTVVVSCIWRRETGEYFVTSVDCILLLEYVINQKFSVEEKNRIRRNLEVCKPMTISKSKPELEPFFRKIMSFESPRPRNISKDVKVFLWSTLEGALNKIVSKYLIAHE